MSGTSSSIKTKLWWNSHWMVLFQNGVRQLRSPAKMATTVQLRCYWKQLWSRRAITGSWEPLVLTQDTSTFAFLLNNCHFKIYVTSATYYLFDILISIGFCDHMHIDTPRPVPIKIRTHDRLVGMSLECLSTLVYQHVIAII